VNIAGKKIELLRDVEIRQYDTAELAGEPASRINSGYASYDQGQERITLDQSVKIHSVSKAPARTTDISSGNAVIMLSGA